MVRLATIIVGFTLLIAGVGMLALPGPGWLTIMAGIALLAREFDWAKRGLDAVKRTANRFVRSRKGQP